LLRLAQKRILSRTLKLRRREIEQRLALFGLSAGPHRLRHRGATSEESQVRRLRAALEGLGPVFSSFGLYMSTRVDLLAAKDSLQLASITDHSEESSPKLVWDFIKQELGCRPDEVYRDFTEQPFASGLLDQQHCASLHDGLPVTVKLMHPEIEELIFYDAQLLHLLQPAFSQNCNGSQLEGAIDDFVLTLQWRTDFLVHAGAVATLSKDMEAFGLLRVPEVQRQLTTSSMLTIERLLGRTLGEILQVQAASTDYVGGVMKENERYALAHRICVAWLRQALLGSIFPAEPSPSNITVLASNQIAFTDGPLAGLPAEAKANLWDYMIAVLTDDPDRACSSLLNEMGEGSRSASEAEFRQEFRQLVPFRDSDWAHGADNNELGQYFFLHWRLASRSGYRPRVHLPSFYRGLFMIARVSRQLTRQGDVLQHALQDVRILAGAEKLRDILTTPRLGEQMDAYLEIMMDLPQRLDEALTLGAKGDARSGFQVEEITETRGKKNSSAIAAALSLTLGATVLLTRHFETNVAVSWSGRIGTVVFALLGVLLLLSVSRRR
jgi:predicted unusual protein kinase regulating ubiquinone biosynthesis (AarF/ABC1/UbiB family)